jgi:hypothetical protein
MSMIDFGASTGSSEAGNRIRPFVKELFEIFYEKKTDVTYFKTLEKLHIAFLVSGKNKDYEGEGPEGLQKVRGRNILIIYCAIPENRWQGVPDKEFRNYLSIAVDECFKILFSKARTMKEIVDEEHFISDFDEGIACFNNLENNE